MFICFKNSFVKHSSRSKVREHCAIEGGFGGEISRLLGSNNTVFTTRSHLAYMCLPVVIRVPLTRQGVMLKRHELHGQTRTQTVLDAYSPIDKTKTLKREQLYFGRGEGSTVNYGMRVLVEARVRLRCCVKRYDMRR